MYAIIPEECILYVLRLHPNDDIYLPNFDLLIWVDRNRCLKSARQHFYEAWNVCHMSFKNISFVVIVMNIHYFHFYVSSIYFTTCNS